MKQNMLKGHNEITRLTEANEGDGNTKSQARCNTSLCQQQTKRPSNIEIEKLCAKIIFERTAPRPVETFPAWNPQSLLGANRKTSDWEMKLNEPRTVYVVPYLTMSNAARQNPMTVRV